MIEKSALVEARKALECEGGMVKRASRFFPSVHSPSLQSRVLLYVEILHPEESVLEDQASRSHTSLPNSVMSKV